MFAIELDFCDGISPPEIILVRRPHAIVGGSEFAHAVIEGISETASDIRIIKGLGREFVCEAVNRLASDNSRTSPFEGAYSGEGALQLGDVRLHVTSLDIDLLPGNDESPDRAGVRVLRRALTQGTAVFPALAVMGNLSIFQSFPPDQPVVIGRSRRCGLRLDAADVSREHSRIGWDGERFWVEDLGSTNGTRVRGERISGRIYLEPRDSVEIGAEFTVMPVSKPEDVIRLNLREPRKAPASMQQVEYPCLVSFSDNIRPSNFPLSGIGRISIGRDPANDIWIGAAHVSRTHAEIYTNANGCLEIVDLSSNGLLVDGERVPKGIGYELPQWMCSIDFTEGNILTICFSQADVEAASNQFSRRESEEFEEDSDESSSSGRHAEDYDSDVGTQDPLSTVFKSPEHRKFVVEEQPEEDSEDSAAAEDGEKSRTAGIFQRMAQRSDNAAHASPGRAGRDESKRSQEEGLTPEDDQSEEDGSELEPISDARESRMVGRLVGFARSLIIWLIIVGGLGALLMYATGSFF